MELRRYIQQSAGYSLDLWGTMVQFPAGSRNFSFLQSPDQFWGTDNLLVNCYLELFHRGWSGQGVSPPLTLSSVTVKNEWSDVSTPLYDIWHIWGHYLVSPYISWDSSVGIVSSLKTGRPRKVGMIPSRNKICGLALGPTQPPFQWIPRNLSPG